MVSVGVRGRGRRNMDKHGCQALCSMMMWSCLKKEANDFVPCQKKEILWLACGPLQKNRYIKMKFGKILAGVVEKAPPEYLGKFLSYKLLKRHIFLHKMGACQCALARQIEGEIELRRPLASGAGASHCHECNRPIYAIGHDGKFTSSVHDGGDNGPRAEDHLQSQVLEFKRLLRIQLWKINVFFTATRQFCYFTMTVRHSTIWPNVFSVFNFFTEL